MHCQQVYIPFFIITWRNLMTTLLEGRINTCRFPPLLCVVHGFEGIAQHADAHHDGQMYGRPPLDCLPHSHLQEKQSRRTGQPSLR